MYCGPLGICDAGYYDLIESLSFVEQSNDINALSNSSNCAEGEPPQALFQAESEERLQLPKHW